MKIFYVDFQMDHIEVENDHLLGVMAGLGSPLTLYCYVDDGVVIDKEYVLSFLRRISQGTVLGKKRRRTRCELELRGEDG